MKLLYRFFRQKADPLAERASGLISAANIASVSAFTPSLDRFPILRGANVEHWDFVLTVAGVFVAVSRLRQMGLDATREQRLMDEVTQALTQWDADAIGAFLDCKGLFESVYDRLTAAGHDPQFVASDALGTWIVWNVLGRDLPDSDEERSLVRATGILVTHSFYDWWDT